jgi:hypothetical protein
MILDIIYDGDFCVNTTNITGGTIDTIVYYSFVITRGYDSGYTDGYKSGEIFYYPSGYTNGYESGYDIGYNSNQIYVTEGIEGHLITSKVNGTIRNNTITGSIII